MRYLITQSLLSAWQYMFDCFEGCENEARESFILTLQRVKQEQTISMLNGIEFENEVYRQANGEERKPHKWDKGINQIANILKGSPAQVKFSKKFSVCDMDFLAYGIADTIKAGHIYDVKFCNSSFGSVELAGKYLNSPQHPCYLFCVEEAKDFTYLVSDGEDLYTECYTREDTRYFPDIVAEFIKSITDMGLLKIYKEKWSIT